MSIQCPYEPYSNTKFWDRFLSEKGLNLSEVKADPTKLLSQSDLARTQTAMAIWVPYIPNLMFNKASMKFVDYHFTKNDLIFAQKELRKELIELDQEFKNQQIQDDEESN